jgi:hypothetical protein
VGSGSLLASSSLAAQQVKGRAVAAGHTAGHSRGWRALSPVSGSDTSSSATEKNLRAFFPEVSRKSGSGPSELQGDEGGGKQYASRAR